MAFPPVAKPPTLLGYHRVLSPSAGVRVSPLCLGAMNFGNAWKAFLGECNKETTFAILDKFYNAGGNFIDTANNYQGEESEQWVGEWIKLRDNRDELVIATKFTSGFRPHSAPEKLKSNFQGNHAKSIRISVEKSLKKLQTTYIDLLYLHWWDFTTGVEELMQTLHHLVSSGKVLYLGISDTPAWQVVKCNEYARFHGLTPFCVYQGRWSAGSRDFEREILGMCAAENMALAPWGALGQGLFRPEEEHNRADREGRKGQQTEHFRIVGDKLREIAMRKDTTYTSIALAYVRHKAPYVFPIIGGRSTKHLDENIAALGIELSDEEMDEIEDAAPFDVGFPLGFLFTFGSDKKYRSRMTASDLNILTSNTALESVQKPRPIEPRQGEKYLKLS